MSSVPIRKWINELRDFATSPITVFGICGFMAYVAYTKTRRRYVTYDDEDYQNEGHVNQPVPLRGLKLTRKQLAEYNSNRADKTYLVALNDVIYDVSSGSNDFGPGRKHALLPGTEISDYIMKESQERGCKYEICLNEWRNLLEDMFYRAGKLVNNADTTLDSVTEEIDESEVEADQDLELGEAGEDTSSDDESNLTTLLKKGSRAKDDRDEEDIETTLKPAP